MVTKKSKNTYSFQKKVNKDRHTELYGDCEQCMRTIKLKTLEKHHGLCGNCAKRTK